MTMSIYAFSSIRWWASVFLYGYEEDFEEGPQLINIEDDEEFGRGLRSLLWIVLEEDLDFDEEEDYELLFDEEDDEE